MPVAIDAPLHVHVLGFPSQRHLIHASVAGFASHSLVHMNAVIEIHEIRKVVDAVPTNRLVFPKTRPHRLQHVAFCPDLLVAIHANRGRRNTGKIRNLDRGMAVSAIDTKTADMMRMTKGDWLIRRYSFAGDIRRIDRRCPRPGDSAYDENASEYCEA